MLLVLPVSVVLLMAAAPSWKDKVIRDWTEADAQDVLADSPWTRVISANLTRLQTEDQRREGGNMGQPHGVGFDGVDPDKPKVKIPPTVLSVTPDGPRYEARPVKLLLRWESALPVRAAELKARVVPPPTIAVEGYMLAVYGIPGGYFKDDPVKLGAPLQKTAFLKREGKKDVKPSSVEVFQRQDGLVAVYIFPPSVEISRNDKRIEFNALIGRVAVIQYFDPAQMIFQGKLEL
jgi:hypothetical protein